MFRRTILSFPRFLSLQCLFFPCCESLLIFIFDSVFMAATPFPCDCVVYEEPPTLVEYLLEEKNHFYLVGKKGLFPSLSVSVVPRSNSLEAPRCLLMPTGLTLWVSLGPVFFLSSLALLCCQVTWSLWHFLNQIIPSFLFSNQKNIK